MAFYDLSKEERIKLTEKININILKEIEKNKTERILQYASDSDTYIRKTTYLKIAKLYRDRADLRNRIIKLLSDLFNLTEEKIRQTVVYASGEIGKSNAESIFQILEKALFDKHHSVRNAVTGALKQMSEKNPEPTIKFAKKHLHNSDPVIKRLIIHGIELRGRTHPEDILPLLKELQNDENKMTSEIIVHVLGQISYKNGCLEKVVNDLKTWQNKSLVKKAKNEILEIHKRYKKFSSKTPVEAKSYLDNIL